MIAIIDYKLGNIRSVENAFRKVGADIIVTSDSKDIFDADGIVVPGVGAFSKAVDNLKELNIYKPIVKSIKNNKPYLGICLGFQLLFTESYEHGKTPGFDILPGKVKKFKDNVKIPHMGWNSVEYPKSSKLFNGIEENNYFYFDHSYYVEPEDKTLAAGSTVYGERFVSAVESGNIWGTQFHPEKSAETGLKMIKGFADYAC